VISHSISQGGAVIRVAVSCIFVFDGSGRTFDTAQIVQMVGESPGFAVFAVHFVCTKAAFDLLPGTTLSDAFLSQRICVRRIAFAHLTIFIHVWSLTGRAIADTLVLPIA